MEFGPMIGSGRKDIAAAFANDQAWPKVMTVPMLFQIDGILSAHLRNSLDSEDMNVNGSVTPVTFEYQVPLTPTPYFLQLNQLILFIADNAITIEKFGGVTALTNGLILRVVDENDVLVHDISPDGEPFKRNWDFYHIAGSELSVSGGADYMSVKWLSQLLGVSVMLRPGWKIQAIVRDDLTSIIKMDISIVGALIPNDVEFVYKD